MADEQLELGLCPWCGHTAEILCDGRVALEPGDTSLSLATRTCSSPVCRACAEVSSVNMIVCNRGRGGKGCEHIHDTVDHCPFCQEPRPESLEREEHDRQLEAHVRSYWGPQRGERVWLIDAHNMVHRLFHGVPLLEHVAPATGQPINAVVGWVRSLRGLRTREGREAVKYVIPIFDGDGDGWRLELHPGYKANRTPCPPELEEQWPLIHAVTEAMRLPLVKLKGVEADDLIAAYTEAAVARGAEVVILSNDKDLLQLVRGEGGPRSVRQVRREKGEFVELGPREVEERFDVGPDLLGDLLALAGDSSDSIPGVPGVGPKTAAKILAARGSLDNALEEWALIPGKASKLVHDHADSARMSRELVRLRDETPLPIELHELRPWVPSRNALDDFFRSLGFPHWRVAVDPARPISGP